MIKKTHEQAELEIKEIYGDEYFLSSPYVKLHDEISITHKKCNRVEKRKYINLKQGKFKCPKCYGGKRAKLTTEDFRKDVFELVQNEFIVLGEYVDNRTPIDVFHEKCGNTIKIKPTNFMSGNRCLHCSGLTFVEEEIIQQRVDSIVGEGKFVVRRKTNSTKIDIKHLNCGFEFKEDFRNFLINTNCPVCETGKFINESAFKYSFELKFGKTDYTIDGEYINTMSRLTFTHLNCGYSNKVQARYFLHSNGCQNCYGSVARKDSDFFKSEIANKFNGEFIVIGDYVNRSTPIEVFHTKCEKSYVRNPYSILKGVCHICNGGVPHTHEQFCESFYEQVGDEYIVIGKYVNSKTNIEILHVECGNITFNSTNNLLAGNRCSHCRESKGEKQVRSVLDSIGVTYKPQATFEDCIKLKKLRFDFGLYDTEGNVIVLIEYDGVQHYLPSFGEKSFMATLESDKIKNDYCINNNIPLLRIPYWEFDNIEEIVFEELLEQGILEEIVI